MLEIRSLLDFFNTYTKTTTQLQLPWGWTFASQAWCGHKGLRQCWSPRQDEWAVLGTQQQAHRIRQRMMSRTSCWERVLCFPTHQEHDTQPNVTNTPGRWHRQPEHLLKIPTWVNAPKGGGDLIHSKTLCHSYKRKPNFPNSNSFMLSG